MSVSSPFEDDDLTELGDGLLVVIELVLGQDLRVASEVSAKEIGKFLRCIQSRHLLVAYRTQILVVQNVMQN